MRSVLRHLPGLAVLMVGIVFSGVFGGAASAQAAPLTPLSINYAIPNAIWWSIDVGIDKGFFKDEGFAPEAIPFHSSPESIQLLISKSVQVGTAQPEALMDADIHGANLIAIAQTEIRPDWAFVVAKSIKNWSDLKGKTIGFSSLKVNEVWLTQKLLAAHGLTQADWTGIQVGITPLKLAAIEKGSIAGGALFEPGAQRALQAGYKALAQYAQLGNYPPSLVLTTRSWATENHNGVRLTKAFRRAHAWLYDPANRMEAEKILAKHTKINLAMASKVYQLLFITEKSYSHTGAVDPVGFKSALELAAKAGQVPGGKIPAIKSMIFQQ